jgi:hypothetical protein
MSEINKLAVDAFEESLAGAIIRRAYEIEDRDGFDKYDRSFIMEQITKRLIDLLEDEDIWREMSSM